MDRHRFIYEVIGINFSIVLVTVAHRNKAARCRSFYGSQRRAAFFVGRRHDSDGNILRQLVHGLERSDSLLNTLVHGPLSDIVRAEHLALTQGAGNQVVLLADDVLAGQTLRRLVVPSAQPTAQRVSELNLQVMDWIKQFKHDLALLKAQREDALPMKASTQAVVQLKR